MRILLLLVLTSAVWGQSRQQQPYSPTCQAPSQSMIEDRLRDSFQLETAEKELREIVKNNANYPLREEVKGLKRRLYFSSRKERKPIYTELQVKFEQMILNAETEPVIENFPYKEASASVSTSEVGTLMMSLKNLNKEELDFLPEETLKKLDPTIKVHYFYPIDKFEYVLTFEGKELPMKKAFTKLQREHEYACLARKNMLEPGKKTGAGGTASM